MTLAALLLTSALPGLPLQQPTNSPPVTNGGTLVALQEGGRAYVLCPLEKTAVTANISGFGAEVTVVQKFTNPSQTPIEAIYTFPLPHEGAVNRMRMKVGSRIIEGNVEKRELAEKAYQQAISQGKTASLLNQERPNIFTQRVGNIMPGSSIEVEITYVQVVPYKAGSFEFVFPMVVAPRNVSEAKDPIAIAPPTLKPGQRSGSTISLNVNLDAGAPIRNISSVLHGITKKSSGNFAKIALENGGEIPNRDFILRYQVADSAPKSAVVSHFDRRKGGFFSLALIPPARPTEAQISPREIIFVMDQSGSQSGLPIQKSKELTQKLIKTLRPGDTFNVMGFDTDVNWLWPSPRVARPETLEEAAWFIDSLQARGGTQLKSALEAAILQPATPNRLKMVLFNTDGFVGNEEGILDTVKDNAFRARLFTFGIGNSCNRYLIDGMSSLGRGDSEIIELNTVNNTLRESNTDKAVASFQKRFQSPVITDLKVLVDGTPISQGEPNQLRDVFEDRPIVVHGRYLKPGPVTITITGKVGGKPWEHTVKTNLSGEANAPATMSLWARESVASLMRTERTNGEAKSGIEKLGLEFGILTPYTSFLAIEEKVVNKNGSPVKVRVPVEMADGVTMGAANAETELGLKRAAPITGGAFGSPGNPIASPGTTLSQTARGAGPGRSNGGFQDTGGTTVSVESKIAPTLKGKKGKISLVVRTRSMNEDFLTKIAALGFKVTKKDEKAGFVTLEGPAEKIDKLAELASVERIQKA